MSTLLLRLAGPLQSWGTSSNFDIRRTEMEPSKSGVIGMVAAALGISREDDEKIRGLASLRMGIRADREGTLLRDYQTAKAKQNKLYGPDKDMAYVTERYYLSDAVFLVGLEGDRKLLEQIKEAFRSPVFPVYLGRRSCPPDGKLVLGIEESSLEEALEKTPMLVPECDLARMVIEVRKGERGQFVHDQPVSFSQKKRQFAFRKVIETFCDKHTPESAGLVL